MASPCLAFATPGLTVRSGECSRNENAIIWSKAGVQWKVATDIADREWRECNRVLYSILDVNAKFPLLELFSASARLLRNSYACG